MGQIFDLDTSKSKPSFINDKDMTPYTRHDIGFDIINRSVYIGFELQASEPKISVKIESHGLIKK